VKVADVLEVDWRFQGGCNALLEGSDLRRHGAVPVRNVVGARGLQRKSEFSHDRRSEDRARCGGR
jgi:hypothetical protein